jgi:hypothetical protein
MLTSAVSLAAEGGRGVVRRNGDLLTVDFRGETTNRVARLLEEQANVTIRGLQTGEGVVSVSVERRPIDDALRRILQSLSIRRYALLHEGGVDGAVEVVVLGDPGESIGDCPRHQTLRPEKPQKAVRSAAVNGGSLAGVQGAAAGSSGRAKVARRRGRESAGLERGVGSDAPLGFERPGRCGFSDCSAVQPTLGR